MKKPTKRPRAKAKTPPVSVSVKTDRLLTTFLTAYKELILAEDVPDEIRQAVRAGGDSFGEKLNRLQLAYPDPLASILENVQRSRKRALDDAPIIGWHSTREADESEPSQSGALVRRQDWSGWMLSRIPKGTQRGQLFAVKVTGDVLRDDAILDGDIVICRRAERAQYYGQLCAIEVQGAVTLRYVCLDDGALALRPGNASYETYHCSFEAVTVIGIALRVERSLKVAREGVTEAELIM